MKDDFYPSSDSADELYHFGVKGMHWGVRKYQNADGSLTQLGKKRRRLKEHADVQKAKSAQASTEPKLKPSSKQRSISDMTDDDLREAIKRADLEAEYRRKVVPMEKTKIEKFKEGFVYRDIVKPNITKLVNNGIQSGLNSVSKSLANENARQEREAKAKKLKALRKELPDADKLTQEQLKMLNDLFEAEDLYNRYVGRDPEVPRHLPKKNSGKKDGKNSNNSDNSEETVDEILSLLAQRLSDQSNSGSVDADSLRKSNLELKKNKKYKKGRVL